MNRVTGGYPVTGKGCSATRGRPETRNSHRSSDTMAVWLLSAAMEGTCPTLVAAKDGCIGVAQAPCRPQSQCGPVPALLGVLDRSAGSRRFRGRTHR
jgi:hypothetical protein